MRNTKDFEVIIIGGSNAGLSSAMALGRSLRSVLIIDSGLPCNKPTPHAHNFLTQDGQKPAEILRIARQQVEKYETVKFHHGLASSGVKTENGFEITTATQEKFTAKKLIFATGIKDLMPAIKGFEACWGISIIHCPYCHGFEFRNQNTGIFANGEKAFHLASLVNNLTRNVIILTNGKADFNEEQLEKLNKNNIKIIETGIAEIAHENGHLKHVVFEDASQLNFNAVYAAIPFVQHSDIPVSLGCEITEHGYIKVDNLQKTTVDHVFACGDNAGMMRSIANAVHSGNLTGAMVNSLLTAETF